MNNVRSLKTFIENRWAEARRVLAEHDPTYISAFEAYGRLQGKLTLPNQIGSTYSLPNKWVDLLESTLDVAIAQEDLDLAVSLLKPDADIRVAHWYADAWKQYAFNLIEKVKVLVSFTCNVHDLGRLKRTYRSRLDSDLVQGRISELRHPLVHGAGGKGTVVHRAITEDLLHPWESSVAAGSGVIDEFLKYRADTRLSSVAWHNILVDHTATLLGNIGGVLDDLERQIGELR